LWLKTLYRKRAVTWPFIFYTIIWTLSSLARQTTSM
ncbi:ATP-dependent Clp protease ATP-binding subunit, partial [Enterococcus lactis]